MVALPNTTERRQYAIQIKSALVFRQRIIHGPRHHGGDEFVFRAIVLVRGARRAWSNQTSRIRDVLRVLVLASSRSANDFPHNVHKLESARVKAS